ncbi:copper chaperone PCu(A)C [Blastococcus xanthinilyticus]|uniref:Copper(I)-binding protein n=1 Tax=Blastococcus xanthinilyticus TaxID=1564164 RepID=A0A5S5CN71_9ACTN|nr:copper chaperone PCu(A)C [Blastococcus xanthinilyticus]TYP83841.1 hypothetical protein BD833_11581 [Blastococcus xanthinilyticus]
MHRRPHTRPFAALLFAAALPLAACGGVADEEESANPIEEIGTEVDGGNAGPDEAVTEDVSLADVELPYPEDGVYSAGEEVPLWFAVTNSGSDPVALDAITGEDFTEAVLRDEGGDDQPVSALEVPGNDNLYVGAPDLPSVVLVGLDRDLRSSQSIPVVFSFANGQEVEVDAMVAAEPTNGVGGDVPEPDEDPTPQD